MTCATSSTAAVPICGNSFLVTGGAGFIGSHLVDGLLEGGARRVVVMDNLVRGSAENLAAARARGCELVQADIRDAPRVADLCVGMDGVFHQAALRITQCADRPRDCLEVLVEGTFNVLEGCVSRGVKKVVAASSASIYGLAGVFPTPESHHPYHNRTWYGAAKMACEGMLRSFHDMVGLHYVALRYFNVYGPRMDIHGKYTEVLIRWLDAFDGGQSPRIFGRGDQTMDFVYVGDVARANLRAMESPVTDDVFNVGTGVETSLVGLLEALADAAGVRLTGPLAPEFLPERKVNPVPRRLADTARARATLAFEAEIGLREGLRRLVAWRQERRFQPAAA
jgi:UDP-glucose 4-epimerase